QKHRTEQSVKTFFDWMNDLLKENFYANTKIENDINEIIPAIKTGKLSPYQAGFNLVQQYLKT
ncbi:MAG: hypothetical protein FWC10_10465, partial [Lentimicrobiaceae bacterium]|nr:hypothetical protein [Lentimicrobiaceae bacterium]